MIVMLCLICGWCVCRRDVSVCLYLWSPCRLIKRLHPQPNFAWFISNGNLFQNITTHRQRCSHLLLLETKYPDMAALSDNIQLGFCFELINAWRMPRFYPPLLGAAENLWDACAVWHHALLQPGLLLLLFGRNYYIFQTLKTWKF